MTYTYPYLPKKVDRLEDLGRIRELVDQMWMLPLWDIISKKDPKDLLEWVSTEATQSELERFLGDLFSLERLIDKSYEISESL